MIRRYIQTDIIDQLDASRTVILGGLPRVGRSTLAEAIAYELGGSAWFLDGKDVSGTFNNSGPDSLLTGQVLIVDDVSEAHVDAIFGILHAIRQGPPPGFGLLLLPRDARTEQRLRENTGGSKSFIELTTVKPLEHLEDSKEELTASSPVGSEPTASPVRNAEPWELETLWWRGGLPESLNAESDADSLIWRGQYIDNVLQADYSFASIAPSYRFEEIVRRIANDQGGEFNYSTCGNQLSITKDKVRASVDLMIRLGLVTELPNWPAGSNKSMSRNTKLYIRDSGLLHSLNGIDRADIRSFSKKGDSWEGFAIEALINASSRPFSPAFYRDSRRNEVDLVLDFSRSGGPLIAIEIKTNQAKTVKKGFVEACDAMQPDLRWLVHSEEASDTLNNGVKRMPLVEALRSIERL